MENLTAVQKMDKTKYFSCSMYYLRRFAGLREILLMVALLAMGLWLYIAYDLFLILIFFGITLALLIFAIILFLITGISGFKHDFVKTEIAYQTLEFHEDKLIAISQKQDGTAIFSEEHPYEKIDKVAIKKGKIYIYAGVSVFYYIYPESLKNSTISDLALFLREHLDASKFKIKSTIRRFPKRAKISIDDEIKSTKDDVEK